MANVAGILGPIITGYIIEWSGMYSIAFLWQVESVLLAQSVSHYM